MIRCEHIYKSFDGKPVLEDISATFLPGEINMIIGRSGSGKTVLIKSIAGLFRSISARRRPSGAMWA